MHGAAGFAVTKARSEVRQVDPAATAAWVVAMKVSTCLGPVACPGRRRTHTAAMGSPNKSGHDGLVDRVLTVY